MHENVMNESPINKKIFYSTDNSVRLSQKSKIVILLSVFTLQGWLLPEHLPALQDLTPLLVENEGKGCMLSYTGWQNSQ